MKQKIEITVKNNQLTEENRENTTSKINSRETGYFYRKNKFYYLVYNDHSEGLDGARTIVRIDPEIEEILLMRKSPAKMKQTFISGQKTEGIYETQYGKLNIKNRTNHLDFNISEKKGKIIINYDLYINGKLSNKNKLKILYREIETDNEK